MLENVNDNFINYWFTNTLEDCGKVIKTEKLNNNYTDNTPNNISNNISNESKIESRNRIVKKSNFNNQEKRIINSEHSYKYKNANYQINHRKDPPEYKYIPKDSDANYNKRPVYKVPKSSNIYDFRNCKRKVLLDSFTRPKLNCYKY